MQNPDNPGPKRKGRAATVIIAILAAVAVAVFIGTNLQNSREVEEGPVEGATTGQPGGALTGPPPGQAN